MLGERWPSRALRWSVGRLDRAPIASASVAIVWCRLDDSILLIQRPTRRGDRWSGHVAFPGGLRQAADRSALDTAIREAAEEVGVRLDRPRRRLLPRVTLVPGRRRPMMVHAFAFEVETRPTLAPAPGEVASAFWAPRASFLGSRPEVVERRLLGARVRFPAVRVEGHVVWGLTLSMIDEWLRLASRA